MTQETTSQDVVLAELTIDEASELVGLALAAGKAELATKVQDRIMAAAENPVLAIKVIELNKPDLTGTKGETDPVLLLPAQTAAVDETAKLPISTQTPEAIVATGVIGANTDGEGSEA